VPESRVFIRALLTRRRGQESPWTWACSASCGRLLLAAAACSSAAIGSCVHCGGIDAARGLPSVAPPPSPWPPRALRPSGANAAARASCSVRAASAADAAGAAARPPLPLIRLSPLGVRKLTLGSCCCCPLRVSQEQAESPSPSEPWRLVARLPESGASGSLVAVHSIWLEGIGARPPAARPAAAKGPPQPSAPAAGDVVCGRFTWWPPGCPCCCACCCCRPRLTACCRRCG